MTLELGSLLCGWESDPVNTCSTFAQLTPPRFGAQTAVATRPILRRRFARPNAGGENVSCCGTARSPAPSLRGPLRGTAVGGNKHLHQAPFLHRGTGVPARIRGDEIKLGLRNETFPLTKCHENGKQNRTWPLCQKDHSLIVNLSSFRNR